ncbi:DUF6292 family protein [Planomonospora sp. ID82291]|uniref:DUF6292 family protein n=1 Tax=Planomonospora sp. ID82291 TaxID=2738136 RepID=UPI0018C35EC7|nr:DUF6292 family protein [Planomonospora sp. ID82291]MBG0814994.1 hypothetical protein [Planomonospora sp. ID82291]
MTPYSEEWLDLPVAYVRQVAETLGDLVATWWDDPCDPRDATIRLTDGTALVWDEESGWRRGRFFSGEKGERTVLTETLYLGGGVLPEPTKVARSLAPLRAGRNGGTVDRPIYRSFRDHHDGFDALLAHYAEGLVTA